MSEDIKISVRVCDDSHYSVLDNRPVCYLEMEVNAGDEVYCVSRLIDKKVILLEGVLDNVLGLLVRTLKAEIRKTAERSENSNGL